MSSQDADQTAGRHSPVFWMVGQSKGTLYKRIKESQHVGDVHSQASESAFSNVCR